MRLFYTHHKHTCVCLKTYQFYKLFIYFTYIDVFIFSQYNILCFDLTCAYEYNIRIVRGVNFYDGFDKILSIVTTMNYVFGKNSRNAVRIFVFFMMSVLSSNSLQFSRLLWHIRQNRCNRDTIL